MSACQRMHPISLDRARQRLAQMLRVDHAGEYGAVAIYRGQRAVFDALGHIEQNWPPRGSPKWRLAKKSTLKHLIALLAGASRCAPHCLDLLWNIAGFRTWRGDRPDGGKSGHGLHRGGRGRHRKALRRAGRSHLNADEPGLATQPFGKFRDDEIGHKTDSGRSRRRARRLVTVFLSRSHQGRAAAPLFKVAERI